MIDSYINCLRSNGSREYVFNLGTIVEQQHVDSISPAKPKYKSRAKNLARFNLKKAKKIIKNCRYSAFGIEVGSALR